jgi:DNA-binding beta-propeller fold protein YncE
MKNVLLILVACGCSKSVSFPANDQFPPASELSFVHQARFAITNNLSDTMSMIAADSQGADLGEAVVGDNPVELEGPHHLAASPDGKYIYYNLSNYAPGTGSGPHGSHGTGAVPGSLVKLDAATMQNVGEAGVGRSPGDVILNKAGTLAFVSHYDLLAIQQALMAGAGEMAAYSPLAIIDTTTMTRLSLTPLCVTAHGEGLSADEKTLYVTCAQTDSMAVVDVSDPKKPMVTMRLPVGPGAATFGQPPAYSPYALTVSPKDGTVWISDNTTGDVRVFDPAQMKMDPTKTVTVGGIAMFAAFSADGQYIYVPHQGDDKVTRIDTSTAPPFATMDLPLPASACLNAHAFVMAPDGQTAVVVCEGDHVMRHGQVVTITVPPFSIAGSVDTGMFSDGAAWLPAIP